MKKNILMLISAAIISVMGCSKSSTPAPPPPSCTDVPCKLTAHPWYIDSTTIITDVGNYTSTHDELQGIPWSTFTFKPDLTFKFYGGASGTYTLANDNTQILAQFPAYLNVIHFDLSVTDFTLTLKQLKVQIHPQTDTSAEARGIVSAYLSVLHNLGVDTSSVHSMQTVFYYIPLP